MTVTLADDALAPHRLDVDVCRTLDRPTIIRAATEEQAVAEPLGRMVGEFSIFNEWYEINSYWEGHFIERIAPGAFKRTINNRTNQSPVRVLLEHGFDPTVGDKPIGVPDILEERTTGCYAETPLLDTSYNRDLAPALSAGAYGQSFRFQPLRDDWVDPDADGWIDTGVAAWASLPQRTITEIRLIELGPTVFPASPATNETTGLRSSTDEFYEQLARRDPTAHEAALRSVRGLAATTKAPAPAAAPTEAAPAAPAPTEDPHTRHSQDSTGIPGHSTDSPKVTHSTAPANTSSRKDITMTDGTMTVEERAARQSEIRARLAEIDTEFAGGELPTDIDSEWRSLLEEDDAHTRAIEATQTRRQELAQRTNNPDTQVGVPSVRRGAPNVITQPDNIFDLAEARQQARSIEELPKIYRDRALRAVETASFPGVESRSKAQEQVARLLESNDDAAGTLARRVLTTGSPTYDRAFGKAMIATSIAGLNAEETRALALGSDTEGGYAVPFQLDPTIILTNDGTIDPIRSLATVKQITGKYWEGVTSAGVTVSRKAEGAESDDNSPTIGNVQIGTTRVDGFIPFSVEIEQDWATMRSEITMLLNEGKLDEEADTFVNGDGGAYASPATSNEPEGLLTGLSAKTFSTATSGAFVREDLYGVKGAVGPRFRAKGSWLAEGGFYDHVRGLDEDGDIWSSIRDGNFPQLLGRPAFEASEMPTFSLTGGHKLAIFGDFSKFYIVDRVGMNVELVPHLFGANHRPTGQRGIWAWWRNGSKVVVPNAFRVLIAKSS